MIFYRSSNGIWNNLNLYNRIYIDEHSTGWAIKAIMFCADGKEVVHFLEHDFEDHEEAMHKLDKIMKKHNKNN